MRILIIAAHPDDEVLGCGGIIARLSKENQDIYIAILGEGISSRYKNREKADQSQIDRLSACSHQAARMLGAKSVFTNCLPDNRFDTVPLLDIVKIIEGLIAQISPEIIYTHHCGDLNIDHVITHRAVLTATRPIIGQKVKEIYAFEIPSSTEWAFKCSSRSFSPNVFFDISRTLDIKLKALAIYDTEVRAFPHPRSIDSIKAIANRWGSVVGCEAAEAYELIRMIR